MTTRHPFMIGIGLALLALAMVGCSGLAGEPVIVASLPPPTQPVPISLPQSVPDVANGATIYAANCVRCHGATGKGDGEMVTSGKITGVPNFTDAALRQDASPANWYEIITNGRMDKLMPPWNEKLSDKERWDVALYVYGYSNTSQTIDKGKTVWASQCTECHGLNNEGTDKGKPLPNLFQRTNAQLIESVSNGIPQKMDAYSSKLSADDIAAVVAYSRTLGLVNNGAPAQVASIPTTVADGATQQPATTQEANATQEANVQPATTPDASAATIGTVGGKVTNMSTGGTLPTDLDLSLYIVDEQNPQAPQSVLDTKMKADGTYQFENVSISASQHYVVMASYKDTVFTSEMVAGDPTHSQVDLPVSIYEVTDNAADIKISELVAMMQVNTTTNQLQVVQIVSFTNATDKAFVKSVEGSPISTSVRLPKGANFQDFSNGTYKLSTDGTQVYDTDPVMPGTPHIMHLGYTLPYTGQMTIDQAMDFALDGSVQVLLGNSGLSITGDQFTAQGSSQMGSQTYQSFGGQFTRAAGQSISYNLTGSLAATTGTATSSNLISPLAYILIAVGLVAIGTAIGFFLRERTDHRRAAPAAMNDAAQGQINALMKKIAELDVRHNEGQISETQYLKRRTALKAELVSLMKTHPNSETSSD